MVNSAALSSNETSVESLLRVAVLQGEIYLVGELAKSCSTSERDMERGRSYSAEYAPNTCTRALSHSRNAPLTSGFLSRSRAEGALELHIGSC